MIHHWFNELVTVSVANEKQADPSSLKKKKKRITLAVDEGDQREVLRVGEAQFEGQQFGDVAYRHGRPQRHRPRHQTALLFVGHQNAQHARLRIRTAWVKRKNEDDTKQFSRRCMVALSQSSLVRSTLIGWYWRHSSSRVNELQWNRYTSTVCHFVATGLFCGSNIQC